MRVRFGGKHPLTIQPLVTARDKIRIRIQATHATQAPDTFFFTQDEIDVRPSAAQILSAYAARPPLGRVAHMGIFDVIADAPEHAARTFLEQPDQSELWMVAETLRRQILFPYRELPLIHDYPNIFYLGGNALVFTWRPRRKLFLCEGENRNDLVYPAGTRIIKPRTE